MSRLPLILSLLLSVPALAKPVAPQLVPLGQKLTVKGEMYKCYVLEEYKTILSLDNELVDKRKRVELLDAKIVLLDDQAEKLQSVQTILTQQKDLLSREVTTMTEKWKQENLARHNAEADTSLWMSAAVAGGGLSILLSIVLLVR